MPNPVSATPMRILSRVGSCGSRGGNASEFMLTVTDPLSPVNLRSIKLRYQRNMNTLTSKHLKVDYSSIV